MEDFVVTVFTIEFASKLVNHQRRTSRFFLFFSMVVRCLCSSLNSRLHQFLSFLFSGHSVMPPLRR